MRARFITVVAATLALLLSTPAVAQWIDYKTPGVPRLPDGKPNLSAPAPRTADGKPDLSGIWQAGRAGEYGYDYDVTQNLQPGDLLPWAKALRMQRVQEFRKDSPLTRCLPVSIPFLNFRGLSRMVQTPGLMVILYESPNSPHRTIFMDGRPLPVDPNPTWLGYSVGRWEDDTTFVVDSNGTDDRTWLDNAGTIDTGTCTRPKAIAPFQTDRMLRAFGMVCSCCCEISVSKTHGRGGRPAARPLVGLVLRFHTQWRNRCP
jgi:hypothetical protein